VALKLCGRHLCGAAAGGAAAHDGEAVEQVDAGVVVALHRHAVLAHHGQLVGAVLLLGLGLLLLGLLLGRLGLLLLGLGLLLGRLLLRRLLWRLLL
jgi:hypothetical protein